MGVDFFPCDACGESIRGAGSYQPCNANCHRRWCDKACAKKDGFVPGTEDEYDGREAYDSCDYCRKEAAEDSTLFAFLLKKHNWTREQVLAEWRVSIPIVDDDDDDDDSDFDSDI